MTPRTMPAVAQVYTSLLNTAGRALERLQGHLEQRPEASSSIANMSRSFLAPLSMLPSAPAAAANNRRRQNAPS